jgi:hypothetical protein
MPCEAQGLHFIEDCYYPITAAKLKWLWNEEGANGETLGEQDGHIDYADRETLSQRAKDSPLRSYSALLAVDNGSMITIYGENGDKYDLLLKAGEMIIFREDLLHAGSGYKVFNLRLFAYVAAKSNPPKNSVHFLVQP